ncbi:unnamed protein product [Medioppia subpectinata]|uniref:Uncharacterized protein n=1 Tax=Medioppia subpectinata TaxID=1979941 RepID=A0A7R9KJU2_9ACAR|nr:unnamed protein product [Medioppia subpectinata]CAG2104998.1 unnamed protein product [Medioppia subpectinata]
MDDDLEEGLEVFLEETFHTSEPIRAKPVQRLIERVWIKDKRPKVFSQVINGVAIKSETPVKRQSLHERFLHHQRVREEAGVQFETDPKEDDDDDQYVDLEEDDGLEDELPMKTQRNARKTSRKLVINLAKKLKNKAIANRLGVTYMPGLNRLRQTLATANRPAVTPKKSWSEKFGRLLAAKKLLYLPLLFRKYKMGPRRTREELDMELDLYMSEVRGKKMRLGFDAITDSLGNTDDNNNPGFVVVDPKKLLNGLGGKGWRKKVKEMPVVCKDALDMEIDSYMADKDKPEKQKIVFKEESTPETKDQLDMDLDEYMSSVKKQRHTVSATA